jgi:hypothetical protein
VNVGQHWQVLITVDPDPNYDWEVAVPQSARDQIAVADRTRAYVVPGFVPVLLAVLDLVAIGFLGLVTVRRLRRRVPAA